MLQNYFALLFVSVIFSGVLSCKNVTCPKDCEYGTIKSKPKNDTECITCTCKPSPCDTKKCPNMTMCQIKSQKPKCPTCKRTIRAVCVSDDGCGQVSFQKQCHNSTQTHYYNPKTNKCNKFQVGVCSHGKNAYNSRISCEQKCQKKMTSRCESPVVKGPCSAYFPRYYYNKKNNSCSKFIFGDCQGNKNNFKTKKQCEDSCVRKAKESKARYADPCMMPAEIGLCKARFQMYYFDSSTKSCKLFIYGGCQGNSNRFQTEKECYQQCKPDGYFDRKYCQLEKLTGPCKASFARFYFNKNLGKCEKFLYGGCKGNENNFKDLNECQQKCEN